MLGGSTNRLAVLEPWGPAAFIVAGILFVPGGLLAATDLLNPLFAYASVLVVLVVLLLGLGGLYPRLTASTPRLAAAGLAATVLAVLVLAVDVAWTTGAVLTGTPAGEARLDVTPSGPVVVFLLAGLGSLAYGVASFRTSAPSRTVGLLLVVAGLSWPGALGLGLLLGDLPTWLDWTAFWVFSVTLLVVGVVLAVESKFTDAAVAKWGERVRTQPAQSSDTTEYVREGFDVDGSESRVLPLSMATRLSLALLDYEWLDSAGEYLRPAYPLLRRVGRLVGRETGVEQYIAEREYIITMVTASDRQAVGSPPWRLAMALFVGCFMLGVGLGWTTFSLLDGSLVIAVAGMAFVAGGGVILASCWRALQRLIARVDANFDDRPSQSPAGSTDEAPSPGGST